MSRFLGPDPQRTIVEVRNADAGWFALSDDVAAFCSDLLIKIRPGTNNGQEVLAAILYRRVLSSFEAVLLLAERGMHTEGLVVRRTMLEALFVLGAIWQQPNLVQTYIENDKHRRRNIYMNLRKSSKSMRAIVPEVTDAELDRQIDELQVLTKHVTYIGVAQFAQAACLHDQYLTDYSILSEAAHHAARDLERQIDVNDDDEIAAIVWGPEQERPFKLLFPAVDNMLMATHVVAELFKLDIKVQFGTLSSRSEELIVQTVGG
jgi:hypothetical protein